MKALLVLVLFPLFAFGQVGINTTDPQAMLDINGNLIIGQVNYAANDFQYLGRNSTNGEVVWVDAPQSSGGHNIQKYFKTPGSAVIISPNTTGTFEQTDINLGLQQNISVGSNGKVTLFIAYKIAIESSANGVASKMGAKFLKDGVEITSVASVQTINGESFLMGFFSRLGTSG